MLFTYIESLNKTFITWFTGQKYYSDGHDRFCVVHKIFPFFSVRTHNMLAIGIHFFSELTLNLRLIFFPLLTLA